MNEAFYAAFESADLDTMQDLWLDHPDVSAEAMTERCTRVFGTVFGDLDPAVLGAAGR